MYLLLESAGSCLVLFLTGRERLSWTPGLSWPEGIPRSWRLAWTTGAQGMSACKLGKAPGHLTLFMPSPGLLRTWRESSISASRCHGTVIPTLPSQLGLQNCILFQGDSNDPPYLLESPTWLPPTPWATQFLRLFVLQKKMSSFHLPLRTQSPPPPPPPHILESGDPH